jgi:hypothetical protein
MLSFNAIIYSEGFMSSTIRQEGLIAEIQTDDFIMYEAEVLTTTQGFSARVTNFRRNKFQPTCLGFTPSPQETKAVSAA